MGEPGRIELTDDLLDFAKGCAIKEAGKHCPRWLDYNDVVQEVLLKLLSKPPKHDPSKGASERTLIYTVVQRIVLKCVAREIRHAGRFRSFPEREAKSDEEAERRPVEPREREDRRVELMTKSWATEDVLEFIESAESRALCRLVIDCGGNVSEAARRLGVSEGTVRYRLKLLAPKLRAAGFEPFGSEDAG